MGTKKLAYLASFLISFPSRHLAPNLKPEIRVPPHHETKTHQSDRGVFAPRHLLGLAITPPCQDPKTQKRLALCG